MQTANEKIRDRLKAPELENAFGAIIQEGELPEKDAGTQLSWIRATRDECAGSLRKATDEEPLISRLAEYHLRSALLTTLVQREPGRSRKQKIQGRLLEALYGFIMEELSHLPESRKLQSVLEKRLIEAMPALETSGNQSEEAGVAEGPLLVVETDAPNSAETLREPMDVAPEALEGETVAETGSEIERLRSDNERLQKELADFKDEWGEGIQIDGKSVTILTHRKIIVRTTRD